MHDPGIVAVVLVVFGSPVAMVGMWMNYRLRARRLAIEEKAALEPGQLAALREENKRLESRIQTLESIVCSVDFEVNARLAKTTTPAALADPSLPPLLPGRERGGGT